ncbi:MAG: hypothetical protein V1845_00560 [bacterium]
MADFKKVCWVWVLTAVILASGVWVAQASDSALLAQSFSQYFSPRVLKAADCMMKARNYQPLGHWKIWTDGFTRKFRGPDGKVELILNWDGMYYIKNTEPEITGDWTLFK